VTNNQLNIEGHFSESRCQPTHHFHDPTAVRAFEGKGRATTPKIQ
jgi:hypothetical protein